MPDFPPWTKAVETCINVLGVVWGARAADGGGGLLV